MRITCPSGRQMGNHSRVEGWFPDRAWFWQGLLDKALEGEESATDFSSPEGWG